MLSTASQLRTRVEAALQHRIPHALTSSPPPAPEMRSTGIAAIDALTGGIPLGCLTEICGQVSSGRTSVLLSLMAECMRCNEICALVDASDTFDPQSAARVGVDLARLLWVRCGKTICGDAEQNKSSDRLARSGEAKPFSPFKRASGPVKSAETLQLEQSLKTTDLLLQAGGFGLVVLDLANIEISAARRIPLTTWFRFRRAVENTSTALVVVEPQPHAKSCASLVMDFTAQQTTWSEAAEADGTVMGTYSGGNFRDDVSFRVTSEGIAIPFDEPVASSFETPQRWNTPRVRLLNALHVYLQVTRSRGIGSMQKFAPRSVISTPVLPSTDGARETPIDVQAYAGSIGISLSSPSRTAG